jgi:hypothetical protein
MIEQWQKWAEDPGPVKRDNFIFGFPLPSVMDGVRSLLV